MTKLDRDIARSGAELVSALSGDWLAPGDICAPVVVFVHGFTSHGRYLRPLARYVAGTGRYVPAVFNYDSYLGIDRAARDLEYLLDGLESAKSEHEFALVGHSMGGLVARFFAQYATAAVRKKLRAIVTLGTPHRGALSRLMVHPLLDWADELAAPNPFARSALCKAAAQLTDATPEGLIGRLNADAQNQPGGIPILSLSGGLAHLEFGRQTEARLAGTLRNLVMQRLIGEKPNDGLVAESSSDITRVVPGSSTCMHRQDYPAYATTNHTYLGWNQQIGVLVERWLREVLSASQQSSQR